MTIIQGVILGIVQGIAEWLPISSEAFVVLAGNIMGKGFGESIETAALLHAGTAIAALIYFWGDIKNVLTKKEYRNELWFLLLVSALSIALAGVAYILLRESLEHVSGSIVGLVLIGVAIALGVTGFLLQTKDSLLQSKKDTADDIKKSKVSLQKGLVLGLVQACAIVPGLSRSGLTISTLLLQKISPMQALRLSFLMSIPFSLAASGGVLFVGFIKNDYALQVPVSVWVAVLVAAIVGYATIKLLLKYVHTVKWQWVVWGTAVLVLIDGITRVI